MKHSRITAADAGQTMTIYAGRVTASTTSRTLSGLAVKYGVPGRTSKGLLKVAPGALKFPEPLTRVKLTKEHDRGTSRGFLASLEFLPEGIRASAHVADGPDGDDALREADPNKPIRDGFSFDVVDAYVQGDTITSATVVAIGQVGIPAYDDTRIDTVAASQTPAAPNTTGEQMTPEQRARLAALRAQAARNAEEETELTTLAQLETANPAPAAAAAPAAAPAAGAAAPAAQAGEVAASFSAVPPGVPGPAAQAQVNEPNPLERFFNDVTAAYRDGNPGLAIQAALNDITYAAHGGIIAQPAWSGELWSGVDAEPEWTDLLDAGDMTSLSGEGWRFVTKPQIQDYAGNKAAIPTTTMTTERSPWTGARMAVGNDFDRAFYDFPNQELLRSYADFVGQDWVMKLDAKVKAYILAHAIPAVGVDPQPTLLKAAAKVARVLKRRNVGKATYIVANDDDFDTLMDVAVNDVPAYLELFGIDPKNFRSSPDVPQGTVLGGVKKAAKVRTLPGSPIRADAQHIANGGIDTAFFGYWAIEEHNDNGIATVEYEAPAEA